jgi:hypothetical protein
MKADELKPRPHATCIAPRSLHLFVSRRILSVLILVAAVISAGCVWSVPEPVLVREPRPETIPLRIGVYYSPEFRNFTYRHHFSDTAWILGKPSVQLFHEALTLLFIEVVEVPRPGSGQTLRDDLAGVIEPRIVSADAVYTSDEHTQKERALVSPVHITYGFALSSPRGERVASWEITGRGEEPDWNPLKRNFGLAMREAAWNFTSGFRDVPEVQRWLAEQAGRQD